MRPRTPYISGVFIYSNHAARQCNPGQHAANAWPLSPIYLEPTLKLYLTLLIPTLLLLNWWNASKYHNSINADRTDSLL